MGSKQLIVSLREETVELLEELRRRKWKLSKQEVVRDAVSEYIEREARKYGLIAVLGNEETSESPENFDKKVVEGIELASQEAGTKLEATTKGASQ
jgi:metal-responsive CopG/Arc/MetJ family transcriptional regulator